jgi:trehalose synthase
VVHQLDRQGRRRRRDARVAAGLHERRGVDSRWLVISGEPDFFRITKRIHNRLHGAEGDGGPARRRRARAYEAALEPNKPALADTSRPATSSSSTTRSPPGWSPRSRSSTSSSIWRLHVGADEIEDHVRGAWDFLRPYIEPADAWVFSRDAFAWDGLDAERTFTIAPSIDVFAPKNEDLDDDEVRAILVAAGLLDGDAPAPEHAIERRADVLEERPLPADRPDGPAGLALGRAQGPPRRAQGVRRAHRAAPRRRPRARRPVRRGRLRRPEGADELERVQDDWRALPDDIRERVHIASLPMDDHDENAWMVNALQRHAAVVVQKSLAEGFGLTVSEGMWKGRPGRRLQGRRHPGAGRPGRDRRARRQGRPRGRSARRSASCSATSSWPTGWARPAAPACSSSSPACATSASGSR